MLEDYGHHRVPANRWLKRSVGIARVSIYLVFGLFMVLHVFDYFKPLWNYIIGALLLLYSIYRVFRFLKERREE